MPYALALMSAAVLGVADFFGGMATRRSGVVPVVILLQTVAVPLMLALILVTPDSGPSWTDAVWSAAAALAGSLGLSLLYHGLATAAMSAVAPMAAVVAAAVPVVGGVGLGERPSPTALAGIVLAAMAIGLISTETGREPEAEVYLAGEELTTAAADENAWPLRAVVVALGAGLGIGLYYVFISRPAPTAGLWPLLLSRFVSLPLFVLIALITRRPLWPARPVLPVALAAAVLDAAGVVFYLLAAYRGPLSLVAILTSLYPASTVLMATTVLGERLHAGRILGLACAAVAILLIVGG